MSEKKECVTCPGATDHTAANCPLRPETAEPDSIEVLGKTCIDGGTCHHACTTRCFRRECCTHFSDYKGPWAYPKEEAAPAMAVSVPMDLAKRLAAPLPGDRGWQTWHTQDMIEASKELRALLSQQDG